MSNLNETATSSIAALLCAMGVNARAFAGNSAAVAAVQNPAPQEHHHGAHQDDSNVSSNEVAAMSATNANANMNNTNGNDSQGQGSVLKSRSPASTSLSSRSSSNQSMKDRSDECSSLTSSSDQMVETSAEIPPLPPLPDTPASNKSSSNNGQNVSSGRSSKRKLKSEWSSGYSTMTTNATLDGNSESESENTADNNNNSNKKSKRHRLSDEDSKYSRRSSSGGGSGSGGSGSGNEQSTKPGRANIKPPQGTSYDNRELKPPPYFYYIDRSREFDDDPLSPLSPPLCVPNFVIKLHAILIRKDLEDVVGWMPHGRSWKIINPEKFEKKVMPDYFKQRNIASFHRQANGWGFRRMLKGPDKGSFYSENFLRGVPHLCKKMKRIGGAKTIESANISHEPNLWSISSEKPLPEELPRDDLNFIVLKTINECVKKDGPKAKMPFIHDIEKVTFSSRDGGSGGGNGGGQDNTLSNLLPTMNPSSTSAVFSMQSRSMSDDNKDSTSSDNQLISTRMKNASYGGTGTGFAGPPRPQGNSSSLKNSTIQQQPDSVTLGVLQQIKRQLSSKNNNSNNQQQSQHQITNMNQLLALLQQQKNSNGNTSNINQAMLPEILSAVVPQKPTQQPQFSMSPTGIGGVFTSMVKRNSRMTNVASLPASSSSPTGPTNMNEFAGLARQVLLQGNNNNSGNGNVNNNMNGSSFGFLQVANGNGGNNGFLQAANNIHDVLNCGFIGPSGFPRVAYKSFFQAASGGNGSSNGSPGLVPQVTTTTNMNTNTNTNNSSPNNNFNNNNTYENNSNANSNNSLENALKNFLQADNQNQQRAQSFNTINNNSASAQFQTMIQSMMTNIQSPQQEHQKQQGSSSNYNINSTNNNNQDLCQQQHQQQGNSNTHEVIMSQPTAQGQKNFFNFSLSAQNNHQPQPQEQGQGNKFLVNQTMSNNRDNNNSFQNQNEHQQQLHPAPFPQAPNQGNNSTSAASTTTPTTTNIKDNADVAAMNSMNLNEYPDYIRELVAQAIMTGIQIGAGNAPPHQQQQQQQFQQQQQGPNNNDNS